MLNKTSYLISLVITILVACNSTPPSKDFPSNWKAVNKLSSSITAIPLFYSYEYRVLVVDETLKRLVERWARDTEMTINYEACYDYTLPQEAADLTAKSIEEAVLSLNEIYKKYPVWVLYSNDEKGNEMISIKPKLSEDNSTTEFMNILECY